MPRSAGSLGAIVLMAVAGCAGAQSSRNGGEAPADPASLAIAILSRHLSVPAADIEVAEVGAIEWPDSSLGCPKSDRDYRPVITPGHFAVLRHAGATFRVHMANGRGFVCEPPEATAGKSPPVPRLAVPVEHLQTLARADLARRVGVPLEEVTLTGSYAVVWPDASLGCPERGRSYEPTQTKGHVLSFAWRGRSYRYHTDLHRVAPCPPIEPE
ncbi:MAG TPA: hypothetical protein VM616_09640 [Gammaproteobacteria bacterium]|nr:hypothetical protein [Gammaproteobacteria bacterium]